jgi:hypothetical protein
MIFTEICLAFFVFLSLNYAFSRTVLVVLNVFFSISIAFYIALNIANVFFNGLNGAQSILIFYFSAISSFYLIKYFCFKLVIDGGIFDKFSHYKKTLILIKCLAGLFFTLITFTINLSFLCKIDRDFVLKNSSQLSKKIIENNFCGLFQKVNQNVIVSDNNFNIVEQKLANTNLNQDQIKIVLQMLESLDSKQKQNIFTASQSQTSTSFVLQIIIGYLKIYPMLTEQEKIVDLYKIEDTRNTLMYGKNYAKTYSQKQEQSSISLNDANLISNKTSETQINYHKNNLVQKDLLDYNDYNSDKINKEDINIDQKNIQDKATIQQSDEIDNIINNIKSVKKLDVKNEASSNLKTIPDSQNNNQTDEFDELIVNL